MCGTLSSAGGCVIPPGSFRRAQLSPSLHPTNWFWDFSSLGATNVAQLLCLPRIHRIKPGRVETDAYNPISQQMDTGPGVQDHPHSWLCGKLKANLDYKRPHRQVHKPG